MTDAIEILPFDTDDATPGRWRAYHRYRRLRLAEDTPEVPVLSDADFEHLARKRWPINAVRRVMALQGEEVVGNLFLEWRRSSAPDHAAYAPFVDVGGGVLQPHRRQGVGTALLRALRAFMEAEGKHTATLSAHLPDAHAFLGAIGATVKLRTFENRLALDGLDWAELARWRDGADLAALGLRWELHAGRVPPERLAQLMAPLTAIVADMPQGGLAGPALRFELQGYLSWYEELDRSGGDHLVVLLLDGDEVAAVCNAHWDGRYPDRVFQALTGVARRWRGQGLAKAVKAAMLEQVRTRHPAVQMVITSNGELNAPMLSINQRLGFAVHRCNSQYQLGLPVLRDYLVRRGAA